MTKYIQIQDEFWDEIEVGENIVIYHNGDEEDIVVPEELGGHPVTRIGKLKPTDEVKSITIPKTVTVIEDDAFDGFPKDFVIYCYPTTQYSNKDSYKIVYLEDSQEESIEEMQSTVEEQANSQTSEQTISDNQQATEEVTSTSEVNEPDVEEKTPDNSVPTAILFIICIILGVFLFIKEKLARKGKV